MLVLNGYPRAHLTGLARARGDLVFDVELAPETEYAWLAPVFVAGRLVFAPVGDRVVIARVSDGALVHQVALPGIEEIACAIFADDRVLVAAGSSVFVLSAE